MSDEKRVLGPAVDRRKLVESTAEVLHQANQSQPTLVTDEDGSAVMVVGTNCRRLFSFPEIEVDDDETDHAEMSAREKRDWLR